MNTDAQKALSYWSTQKQMPKAKVYADAIKAHIDGDTPNLENHELSNAISRGASLYDAKGMHKVVEPETPKPVKRERKARLSKVKAE